MAAVQLSTGLLAKAAKEETQGEATLKVVKLEKLANGNWTCTLYDGSSSLPGRFTTQYKKGLDAGTLALKEGAIIKVQNYAVNALNNGPNMIITSMEILQEGDGRDAAAVASDAAGSKPDQQATPAAAKQPPSTPAAAGRQQGTSTPVAVAGGTRSLLTPGPTPSPSEELKGTPAVTPSVSHQAPFTPMSTSTSSRPSAAAGTLNVTERANVQPIAALNPYQRNWCIKAKVTRKGLMRTTKPGDVFDVELADAEGTQIQGTFWKDSAHKYYDSIEEGKVYYFTNFSVKVANKQYTSVRNDYQINFETRTEVEEAKDQSSIKADVQVDLVPFDKLVKHIGRKAPVDVLGLITSVGQVGSVKRKVDNGEVVRRELTLADKTGLSVNITVWGDAALRDDYQDGGILQVTAVRVSDFNGCSLSALTRSKVTYEPEGPEAAELRNWWSTEGSAATITPVGQSVGGGASNGVRRLKARELLSAVTPDVIPPPDAKPTYHDVAVTVTQVLADDQRKVYYLANPENNKKVVKQDDGRLFCAGDDKFVEQATNRYMATVRVADLTGQVYSTVFNDQGEVLFGCSADDAAKLEEAGDKQFDSLLRRTQWTEWQMTLMARSREYQGERKLRVSVHRITPMDYAKEGYRLLELIQPAGAPQTQQQ